MYSAPAKPESTPLWLGCENLGAICTPLQGLVWGKGRLTGHLLCLPFLGLVLTEACIATPQLYNEQRK